MIQAEQKYKKIVLPVKGMHCASCAINIQNNLRKTAGVISCEVNFGNEKAKIQLDQSLISLEELNSKIEPMGYSFDLSKFNSDDIHDSQINQRSDFRVIYNSNPELLKRPKLGKEELEKQRQKGYFYCADNNNNFFFDVLGDWRNYFHIVLCRFT